MDPSLFIQKWRDHELTERSASHEHFIDLCSLVDHPTPAEVDKTGDEFTFEKGATKTDGSDGWADVWKRGYFGWEYKGPGRDLDDAYKQLLEYREALENPPLLVVCDMERIVVHTNFTSTPTEIHEIKLSQLTDPRSLEILQAVFHHPEKLKPGTTSESITTEAAEQIWKIAVNMRERGLESHDVAHFLDRIVFCLFAEDIELLPDQLFSRILDKTQDSPDRFHKHIGELFDAMASGGDFAMEEIRHFNGNLFAGGPVLEMTYDEIDHVRRAAKLDWSAVDPSIFGTLFERGMDPDKRSQIGAHYTSREDIETLVDPVVMWPLEHRWKETKETVENLLRTGRKSGKKRSKPMTKAVRTRSRNEANALVRRFHDRLCRMKVLDPACGSGNFLYVTLQKLKDLEKEINLFCMEHKLDRVLPRVGPWQLYGIEISPYAFDLAQMVVWIGYLQWVKANGYGITNDPVLRPMEDNFQNRDAILDLSDPDNPKEPEWPKVDYIVSNPPFLGNRFMPDALGDSYIRSLSAIYEERLGGRPDLCCYWFEKARDMIARGKCQRAGLIATQGIRGGTNRNVLRGIKDTGDIFFAESDRNWILDGANVHVSMVGFDAGDEQSKVLDKKPVPEINADLSSGTDLTQTGKIACNSNISFQGTIKRGSFDIKEKTALGFLHSGGNPNGRPNSDVIVPFMNARDITKRRRWQWIIDFGSRELDNAARYEKPFQYLKENVYPERQAAKQKKARELWWQLWCPRESMWVSIRSFPRFIGTPRVAKHRIFVWLHAPLNPDCQIIVFSRQDDYFFGILHSRLHEVWARAQGTQLRERESGFRYTPTTCFETFPFPWRPGGEPEDDPIVNAIAEAARELNELRENWLNPDKWTVKETLEFPGSVDGPWAQYVAAPDESGIGTVRYERTVPDPPFAKYLKERTLTNLYNENPTWLQNAHRKLDEAVCQAYTKTTGDPDWHPDMDDEEILEKLLELNLDRSITKTAAS